MPASNPHERPHASRSRPNAEPARRQRRPAARAFRGEVDEAFAWLERAYSQRDPGLMRIKSNPLFKNLVADPRYTALLKRVRLPL